MVSRLQEEVERRFFIGHKTAVAAERLYLIDSRKVMDDEDPLETRMTCRRTGTTPVPATFWFFLVDQKELAAETVDQQKFEE